MKKPIRVLFFIGSLGTGGSEAHLARLLPRLDRGRVSPELLVLRAEGFLLNEVRAAGVPVHDVSGQNGTLGRMRRYARIRSFLRSLRPDVIHAYGFPCDVYTPILSLPRGGSRVVTSRRGNQELAWRRFFYRLTNRLVTRVVCVSRATEQFAIETEGLSRRRSTIIPNGIDISSYPRADRAPAPIRTVGTVGRVKEVKGSDLLLEAFSRLQARDLTLKMGGPVDSAWAASLRSRYERERGVSFCGEVQDVPGFLRSLDLFVLPSRSEGMSNALLEAMAAGLPVIATDVGSNREVLADGRAGVLVTPDASSIAGAMASLIGDPSSAALRGRAARDRVETEYDLSAMVRRYEDFYEELVSVS